MIKQSSNICLGTPDEDHTIAKHFIRESQLFLNKLIVTKDSMEVVFQSTLMNIP